MHIGKLLLPVVLLLFETIVFSCVSTTFALSISDNSNSMKRVLVTGGNKGIGRAICAKLLSEHSNVQVLLGCRDESRGKKAVEELKGSIDGCGDDRLELVILDPASDDSVLAAAKLVQQQYSSLYGIVNNAGTLGNSLEEAINVNYFGPRRVNDAFQEMLEKNVGRIVNIASASGPMFVASCGDATLRNILANPLSSLDGGVEQLDNVAKSLMGNRGDGYGLSKALLNAYTLLHAKSHPHLLINSCTPGFIDTDMTRNAGMGATNAPEKGTIAPLYCLLSDDLTISGRYYGSDAVRSPLDRYRGPGDPPYQGP